MSKQVMFKTRPRHSVLSFLFVALCISAFLLLSCSSDENVQRVKASKLSGYTNKTIGEAIDGFFANPKWSSGTSEQGVEFVNAEGKITYANKEVNAVLQFKLSKDKKTFEVNALEFNGVPQNQLMIAGLLDKIYEK
jgi:hypothetical protein